MTAWPDWHDPDTGAPLREEGDALVGGARRYPIRDGIPRFVPHSDYAAAFAEQWKRWRRVQLDSATGFSLSEDRLRRCLGEEGWADLPGKLVLEAGCGAGRFTEILLRRGARVMSIDLSEAVDANVGTCPLSDRHRVAQADITRLPFAPGRFDHVVCLGVIQHTPSPEATIAALARQVRPGGQLTIDHYTPSLQRATKLANYTLRPVLRRVGRKNPQLGIRVTEALTRAWLPLHKAVRGVRPAQFVLSRVSPVLAYHHVHPELPDDLLDAWAYLDTHDALTDWFKHLRTPAQIRAILQDCGLEALDVRKDGIGVEARARAPR